MIDSQEGNLGGTGLRRLIGTGLTVATLGVTVWYLVAHPDLFEEIREITFTAVLVAATVFIFQVFVRSQYIRVIFARLDIDIGIGESFAVNCVATGLNLTMPGYAGAGFRAAYMRKRYGVDLSRFTGSLYPLTILIAASSAAVGTVVILGLALARGALDQTVLAIFGLSLLLSAVGIVFAPSAVEKFGTRFSALQKVAIAVHDLATSRALRWQSLVVAVLLTASTAVNLVVMFPSSGNPVSVWDATALAASQTLSSVITLTPGGLGLQEGLGLVVSRATSASLIETAAVLLSIRAIRIVTGVVMGAVSALVLAFGRKPGR